MSLKIWRTSPKKSFSNGQISNAQRSADLEEVDRVVSDRISRKEEEHIVERDVEHDVEHFIDEDIDDKPSSGKQNGSRFLDITFHYDFSDAQNGSRTGSIERGRKVKRTVKKTVTITRSTSRKRVKSRCLSDADIPGKWPRIACQNLLSQVTNLYDTIIEA